MSPHRGFVKSSEPMSRRNESLRLAACWLIALAILLVALPMAAAAESRSTLPVVSLQEVSSTENIATSMLGFNVAGDDGRSPEQLLGSLGQERWRLVAEDPEMLEAPRQHATLWLLATLENSADEPLTTWLDFDPWRLNRVEAWLMTPETQEVLQHVTTGLEVPLAQRDIDSNRTLVPVSLPPGESATLLIKVYSDSRPFLAIQSWDPIEFSVAEVHQHQAHYIILAAILTLLVVLLLQFDFRFFLIGAWLLVTFVFESEKEGFFTQVVFGSLESYAANLRFTTWILAAALFLVVSIYLLGLNRHRHWRRLIPFVMGVALLFGALTFLLDGATIRHLGNVINVSLSAIWLGMLPAALAIKRPGQRIVLGFLSTWWVVSTAILLGYITNIYYTSSFSPTKAATEVTVVLGSLLVYAWQKRYLEEELRKQAQTAEQRARKNLETLVDARTADLNIAMRNALEANKSKTFFLGRVSHDLKSPLTSIMGYSQLLAVEKGQVGDMGQFIHGSAMHMEHLVNRLIDYSKEMGKGDLEFSNIYLYSFFSDIEKAAKVLAARKSNSFQMQLDGEVPSVILCDATSLRQILSNLIDNSSKYTRQGIVKLQVSCTPKEEEGSFSLDIVVEDSGSGISDKVKKRLFEPFVRESYATEGSGLGLGIVKELVERLGGEITITSEPGAGTRVALSIPITQGNEESSGSPVLGGTRELLPRFDAGGMKAWVVEDSAVILELLRRELASLNFEVSTFQSGEEAIAALGKSTAALAPDLVITDHLLPNASGDEVLKAVQQHYPTVPVMLLSATWSVLHDASDERRSGYAACLGKPINLMTLRRKLARLCGLEIEERGAASNSQPPAERQEQVSMNQLKPLLEMGAVSDIIEWCNALAEQQPELAAFADDIRRHAIRSDFSAISAKLKVKASI